jgi:hypothetical protein
MEILLTGDLHLGRSSSGTGPATAGHRAADAWNRIVGFAIARRVGAVILSGDVVDHSNRFFEAAGPLTRGIRRLADAGIPTVAVAGNHDHSVLPTLASQWADPSFQFTLLGRGGTWEEMVLFDQGHPALRLVGWSFPTERHRSDPLAQFPDISSRDLPVLGLVHGDLDSPGSVHTPLRRSSLRSAPVHGWLLGHIHLPSLDTAPGHPWILYPGSPQALDPGEQGVHGVWTARVSPAGIALPEPVPLSSVRYEAPTVSLTDVPDDSSVRTRLHEALVGCATAAREEGGEALRHLIVDLVVDGSTSAAGSVDGILDELRHQEDFEIRDVQVVVRSASNHTTQPIDIEAISQGHSLSAHLARLIRDLESGKTSTDANEALAQARNAIRSLPFQSTVRSGDGEEPFQVDDPRLRTDLAIAARRLLGTLIQPPQPVREGARP